jgi:hypothetical protein
MLLCVGLIMADGWQLDLGGGRMGTANGFRQVISTLDIVHASREGRSFELR